MLTTGIELEARPPGKKVKRLSLLSGGEKSLAAVAMLVAIFRARPSPFYVMDEVEAALDDTNLHRLISLFEQLRERSQLLIITHQKPTMEIADALYGVSMRGDGISQVISQRLRTPGRRAGAGASRSGCSGRRGCPLVEAPRPRLCPQRTEPRKGGRSSAWGARTTPTAVIYLANCVSAVTFLFKGREVPQSPH